MKKRTSLKWKIAKYLILFATVLIALIAFFQTVLLEPMYENSKINTVKEATSEIVSSIHDDNITDKIYRESAENDLCVRVYSENSTIYAGNMGCVLYRMSDVELLKEISNARSNNNSYISTRTESFDGSGSESSTVKDITCTRIVEDMDKTYIVMVNTSITPVDATVSTLTKQLWIISGFVLIVVVILVLVMNKRIAAPLIALNESAKSLAKGTYVNDESKNTYQEVYELNETLKQASVDIQKADKAKRDLIANVSHDLRTPLTMISGYGEMMKDLPGEKTDENCQVIIDEAKRLTYLVNDLLDLSKLQENKITLNKSVFDLSKLVQREIRKYDVYSVQEGYSINVETEDSMFIEADESRIEQVFNNFMTNAINYSSNDKRINVRVLEKDNQVVLEVEDHGVGISKENLPDIWDRYYKINAEHIRFTKGSGIGLAIVKEILELHKADYGVNSEEGKGSIFYFKLPKVKETE